MDVVAGILRIRIALYDLIIVYSLLSVYVQIR